ncbi:MAG: ATP-binding protein [Pseudomonadota bacterium]
MTKICISFARRKPVGFSSMLFAAVSSVALLGFAPSTDAKDLRATDPVTENSVASAFEQLIATSQAQMMKAPADAYAAALSAEELASAMPADLRTVAQAKALWLKAEAALRSGKPEEGASAASAATAIMDTVEGEDTLRANILLIRGRIASRLADVELAVNSFYAAHALFVEVGNTRKESITLQALGSIYRDAESFDKALDYYQRAADIYQGDDIVVLSINNNVGNILRETGDYPGGRERFNEALDIAQSMGSATLQGRILTNRAELEVEAGDLSAATLFANAARDQLSDDGAASWLRLVSGVDASVALRKDDLDGAKDAIEQAFDGLNIDETSMSYEDLHATAADVYNALGDWEKAYQHKRNHKRLSDEAKSVAASSNLALLGARFQYAEQQLNIERLRNERLESERALMEAERRDQVQKMVIAAGGVVVLFAFLAAFGILGHNRRVAKINKDLASNVKRLGEEIERRELVEADLIKAKEQAEDADRMKSNFLATMSHELRTPMNGILGFTDVLLAGDLSQEQREQIEIIDQSAGALLTLINDILDLSQLEAGKFKLRNSMFNLRVTAEHAVKLLRAKAQEKSLNLMVHVDPSLPTHVHGDEDRVRQILINLIGNAVKFTERGGVAVRVQPSATTGEIEFSVEDSGIGIAEEKTQLLFERFSQVDEGATRQYQGSGLGLAICKELVTAMDGEIGCTSELGTGSTFRFSIPLPEGDAVAITPKSAVLTNSPRVVLVDDEAIQRRVVADMLESIGAQAIAFNSKAAAFDGLKLMAERGELIDAMVVNGTSAEIDAPDFIRALERNNLLDEGKSAIFGGASSADQSGVVLTIDQPMTITSLEKALTSIITDPRAAGQSGDAPAAQEAGSNVVSLAATKSDKPVLIVDDVLANRKLLECVLEKIGIKTVSANNGLEAVEFASVQEFGAILMDVYMPVLGGIDATSRIRSTEGPNRETPIFALTAGISEEETKAVKTAAMDGLLTKPVNVKLLRSTVLKALDGQSNAGTFEIGEAVAGDAS